MFLVFIAGCLMGWVYEEIFYRITEGLLRNRGILYGPWLPIYGIGALGIYALKSLKRHPVWLFLLCVAVTGAVEYILGCVSIRVFGLRLRDYRGLFLNIDGIICFHSVICFGIMLRGSAGAYADQTYPGIRMLYGKGIEKDGRTADCEKAL